MYESIRIQNFRGIEDLTITDLGRVNLIVGANNAGKTSVLEALALLRLHLNDYELKQILEARGYVRGESESGAFTGMFADTRSREFTVEAGKANGTHDVMLGLRHDNESEAFKRLKEQTSINLQRRESRAYDLKFPLESLRLIYASDDLSGLGDAGFSERTLDLEPATRFPVENEKGSLGETAYVPASPRVRNRLLPEYLTDVRRRGLMEPIVEALREFDSRIRDVSVAASVGKVSIDVEFSRDGSRPLTLPWTSVGDGIRRLWEMLIVLQRAYGGIGLVDEIDTGICFENLPKLWKVIDSVSTTSNVQIFATAHSWECVMAASRSFSDAPEDLRVHRLERHGEHVSAFTYPPDILEAAVLDRVEVG